MPRSIWNVRTLTLAAALLFPLLASCTNQQPEPPNQQQGIWNQSNWNNATWQ